MQKSRAGSKKFENLFLVGFMGAGKSTVGKILAKKLGWEFVDSDSKIEENSKCKIAEIIDGRGLSHFRKVESKMIADICKKKGQVVALGGGSVLNALNRKKLKAAGVTVQLDANTETLFKRLLDDRDRPLIRAKTYHGRLEKIQKLYRQRQKHYNEAASRKFATDHLKPAEVAAQVQQYLGEKI